MISRYTWEPVQLFFTYELFSWVLVVAGVVAIVMSFFSLQRNAGHMRTSVFALALSTLPLMVGLIGSLNIFFNAWGQVAGRPVSLRHYDIWGGLSIAVLYMFFGLLFGGPLIFLNLIAVARRLPTYTKDASNA